jgi:hypothetical protein
VIALRMWHLDSRCIRADDVTDKLVVGQEVAGRYSCTFAAALRRRFSPPRRTASDPHGY